MRRAGALVAARGVARPDADLVSAEEILDDAIRGEIAPAGDKYQELTEIEDPSTETPEQRLLETLSEILTRYRDSPAFQELVRRRVEMARPDYTRRVPLTPARDYQLFIQETVPAGEIQTISTRVDVLFRPDRIVVDDESAPHFDLVNLLIGSRPQRPQGIAPTPCRYLSYAAQQLSSGVRYDTIQPGLSLHVVVENKSNAPQVFRAWAVGRAIV